MLPTQQPTEHPTAGHRCTTPPGLARRLVAPVAMAAGAGSVCAAIWFADPTTPGGLIPPCPTRTLLGIDCPGCGTCRMLYSLLHGDLPAALHYNALALVAVIVLVVNNDGYVVIEDDGGMYPSDKLVTKLRVLTP